MYDGPVVFVEGVHYPIDAEGHADLTKPLRWTPDGYRDAQPDEPLHNDTFHASMSELEVGGE